MNFLPSKFTFLRRSLAMFACAALSGTSLLATVTIEVCYEDGNLADGSVAVLVADVTGLGFLSPSDASAVGTVLAVGETIGDSDDKIIAVLQADSGAQWSGSAGILDTIAGLDYDALGITPMTPLILYSFPNITQLGASLALGDEVNSYRNEQAGGSGGTIGFEAPADSGVYTLAAVRSGLGGTFDPSSPTGSETFESEAAGLPGGGGGPDDHGSSRSTATDLTSGIGSQGSLSPGDLDYFAIAINGPTKITAYTSGATDTVGFLYAPDGSAANFPANDDDAGEATNFRSVEVVSGVGNVSLAVRGKDDSQTGDYEVFIEAEPLPDFRTDLTIGKTPGAQLGNGTYNSSGAGQTVSSKLKKVKTSRFYFAGQNDGGLMDSISMRGTKGNRNFKVAYIRLTEPAANVTASMITGTQVEALDPLDQALFRVQAKGSRKVKKRGRGSMNLSMVASSSGGGTDLGKGRIKVKVKKKKKRR